MESFQSLRCANCGHQIIRDADFECTPVPQREALSHLFSNNDPPPIERIKFIRNSLEANEKALQNVEEEIARIEEYLDKLDAKRSDLLTYVRNQKILLNPVRRIPEDIWVQVFSFCVRPSSATWMEEAQFQDSLEMTSSPWAISHVCSKWRGIAISLSSLWCNIQISLYHSTPSFGGLAMLLALHIRRSGSKPLSVHIDMWASHLAMGHSLLGVVAMYSERWKFLRIDRVEISYLQQCFSVIKPTFPMLHTLILQHVHMAGEEQDTNAWDIFQGAPALRFLSLDHYPENPSRLLVPYSQLTTIHFNLTTSDFPIHDILAILRSSAATLEEFHIDQPFPEEPNPGSLESPIILPRLLSYCVSDPDTSEEQVLRGASQLLEHITPTKLQSFRDRGNDASMPLSAISSMFQRSECPLDVLTLTVSNSNAELVEFLQTIPSTLSHLCLTKADGGGPFTEVFISALICEPGVDVDECLLPNLSCLELKGGMSFDASVYVDMIDSRWRVGDVQDLVCVKLDCTGKQRPTNPAAFDRFSQWMDVFEIELDWTLTL
ncbi:hypothetical protein Moror_10604 [Moniliophthora roreri MCA 2997]|uniref:F-box domain-containing protein n=1 Tax=Moniliophthora roreri (strain MCA 2997) TaxID=1381753 RepID=V2XH08_MONRO|nr:hypothetical protein Moror_10604 [Moniliophthora roreri MCA 2997]